ncbi:MAG: N-formylglutamate amidohydrolase [Polyangiaceae bacterium]|nr:N-formylglutamate amidohydrolase [Polyangiaceae bacterium]MCE7889501.1 N-formylglutamate amidohydrolase [Sorangiineae bacterium PRO1]MCL4755800.1 N-formylglutamate amidohydrolase [Myxococcales bacterium]
MESFVEDAVEVVVGGSGGSPFLITCEHASERLPEPWRWAAEDRWLVGTHWAYDIGAEDLARDLCAALGATAVLSRFSRLLADPNREESARDLFLALAEGEEVRLNHALDAEERERRLARLWRPYHAAVEREVARSQCRVVLAIHTFTPVWNGVARDVEVGVLFDEEEELAERARAALGTTGLVVRMNEPYSGQAGLIYSARRHAMAHGRRALELEVRQDLAVEARVRAKVVAALGELGKTLG